MNTKLLPAILALVAGFITCIMSFIQRVDIVIFAKRFVIVCIIFFVIGIIAKIVLDMNFKETDTEENEQEITPEENDSEEDELEDIEESAGEEEE